jgi:hypothetical protein
LRGQAEKSLEEACLSREAPVDALSKINRVPAQMHEAFAGTRSACHAGLAALKFRGSRSGRDNRFSTPVVIALGILSSLMMAFPLILNLSHRF